MRKLSLTIVAVIAITTATLAPSLVARAQSAPRFDYLRVTPYGAVTQSPGRFIQHWGGYRACVATSSEWTCREFEHTIVANDPIRSSLATLAPNDALRTALATLGNEGWELVSAVDEKHELNGSFGGPTYLFRRQKL